MCESEFIGEALVAARFLHGIQIGALEILDQRQREQRAIVDVANDRGDIIPAESCRSTKATLAGDELEIIARPSDGNRLQQTGRLERRLKLVQLRFIELASRLIGIGPNSFDRDPLVVARGWR